MAPARGGPALFASRASSVKPGFPGVQLELLSRDLDLEPSEGPPGRAAESSPSFRPKFTGGKVPGAWQDPPIAGAIAGGGPASRSAELISARAASLRGAGAGRVP